VRQVSRFLDDLMRDADRDDIERGLHIPSALGINGGGAKDEPSGRSYRPSGLEKRKHDGRKTVIGVTWTV
jgi:hypothetical protein